MRTFSNALSVTSASDDNESNKKNKKRMEHYFTDLTCSKGTMYIIILFYVVAVAVVAVMEPFLSLPCLIEDEQGLKFENPAFNSNPCRQLRYPILMGFTPEECSNGRKLLAAIILGSVIGWERRQADRPAGIRTMALVSLGSCLFTINSAFAFLDGPMSWDASRISAAIPSGVGFLGAGLIFKKEEKNDDGTSSHVVHGLTTAASLWLSAAVGIACGGERYFAASFTTSLLMIMLRFGPRLHDDQEGNDDDENDLGGDEEDPTESAVDTELTNLIKNSNNTQGDSELYNMLKNANDTQLAKQMKASIAGSKRAKFRKRSPSTASLASAV